MQNGLCYYCHRPVVLLNICGGPVPENAATIDHRHPLSKGGTSQRSNLVVACRRCNQIKGSMSESDFTWYIFRWLRWQELPLLLRAEAHASGAMPEQAAADA